MKDTYVQAVLELIDEGVSIETVLPQLHHTLVRRGHSSLYASILTAVERVLDARRPGTFVVVAQAADYETQKDVIAKELAALGADPSDVAVLTDATLIGGRVVEHNHTRTDKSYKQALLRLYRSVTEA
jgi:F0F1-type ATP synthase delta subunit